MRFKLLRSFEKNISYNYTVADVRLTFNPLIHNNIVIPPPIEIITNCMAVYVMIDALIT